MRLLGEVSTIPIAVLAKPLIWRYYLDCRDSYILIHLFFGSSFTYFFSLHVLSTSCLSGTMPGGFVLKNSCNFT